MYEPDLDPFTADAILDGDPAPSTPVDLAGLMTALKSPPTEHELAGGEDVFVRAIGAHGLSTVSAGTSVVRRLTKKTVALGAAGAVLFGGVAAATGALPVLDTVIPGGDEPTLVSVTDEEEEGEDEGREVDTEVDDGDDGDGGGDRAETLIESNRVPDGDGSEEDLGDRVSAAAQSECGKPETGGGSEDGGGEDGSTDGDDGPVEGGTDDDPYAELCESARNHGEYVSTVARDKDGDGTPDVGKEQAPGQLKKMAADDGGEDDGSSDSELSADAEPSSSESSKGRNNGQAKGKNKD